MSTDARRDRIYDLLGDVERATLNDLARRLAEPGGACGWTVAPRPDLHATTITVYGTDAIRPEQVVDGDLVDAGAKVREVAWAIPDLSLDRIIVPEAIIRQVIDGLTRHVDAWEKAR